MLREKQIISAVSIAAFICGALLLSFKAGWLIIRYPSYRHDIAQQKATLHVKRTPVIFHYFKDNNWHTENSELLWGQDVAYNIQYLINSWLSFLDEEHLMKKKITVATVLLSSTGSDAYISFDRNPLNKEASAYAKWMWIEGLLKTLRDQGIKVPNIHFLVHHQPLTDTHLDFSNPWPIQGYLSPA